MVGEVGEVAEVVQWVSDDKTEELLQSVDALQDTYVANDH